MRSRDRLRRACLVVAVCLTVCTVARGQGEPSTTVPGETADAWLADVVSRLPRDPIVLKGVLHVRRPRGLPVADWLFEMHLAWGAAPATARYIIRDMNGGFVEQLLVTRPPPPADPTYEHIVGEPPVVAELHDAAEAIRETDMTWTDLTLAFLWWKGGAVAGSESIRGRPAVVLDVPAPAEMSGRPYARVRVWVDEEARILLQAEGYDTGGGLVRSLWVKSFRKIDDRWMIKDIEIQSYPVQHRTRLRVNEVTTLTASGDHERLPLD